MTNLLRKVNDYLADEVAQHEGVFFIKDGDNWTIEFGLSKKERAKHDGVYLRVGEIKGYQSQLGVAMYIETKYYGNCDFEAPGRVCSQLEWTEKVI